MKLHHINIQAPLNQLLVEKQFFSDVLGIQEGFRPKFSMPGIWLYSEGTPVIHLNESTYEWRLGAIDHVAFVANDLPAFIDTLQQHAVEYKTSYVSQTQTTQIFIRSPIGIKLEFQFINEKLPKN